MAVTVQRALALATKKEAEHVIDAVIESLESTLLNHLGTDGFTLKLNGFGKFNVRHRPGILKRIPFTGERGRRKASSGKVRFGSRGALVSGRGFSSRAREEELFSSDRRFTDSLGRCTVNILHAVRHCLEVREGIFASVRACIKFFSLIMPSNRNGTLIKLKRLRRLSWRFDM